MIRIIYDLRRSIYNYGGYEIGMTIQDREKNEQKSITREMTIHELLHTNILEYTLESTLKVFHSKIKKDLRNFKKEE